MCGVCAERGDLGSTTSSLGFWSNGTDKMAERLYSSRCRGRILLSESESFSTILAACRQKAKSIGIVGIGIGFGYKHIPVNILVARLRFQIVASSATSFSARSAQRI